ncbi:MAG: hypothetical protein NZM06_12015 [Chloroherpetonaceae bacterium]|nr:hypothetical protein [Chloroherpetonaceae bacterium]
MRKQDILAELEETAKKLGYRVRYEKGSFIGGDCRVRQDKILVVNKFLPIEGRITTIARALGRVGVEGVFLTPEVRKVIEDAMGEKISEALPDADE